MNKLENRIIREVLNWEKPVPRYGGTGEMTDEQYKYFCKGATFMSREYVKRISDILVGSANTCPVDPADATQCDSCQ